MLNIILKKFKNNLIKTILLINCLSYFNQISYCEASSVEFIKSVSSELITTNPSVIGIILFIGVSGVSLVFPYCYKYWKDKEDKRKPEDTVKTPSEDKDSPDDKSLPENNPESIDKPEDTVKTPSEDKDSPDDKSLPENSPENIGPSSNFEESEWANITFNDPDPDWPEKAHETYFNLRVFYDCLTEFFKHYYSNLDENQRETFTELGIKALNKVPDLIDEPDFGYNIILNITFEFSEIMFKYPDASEALDLAVQVFNSFFS